MDLGLENKVAVVTGGSAGIGLKTAEMFLKEGAKVAICGRNKEKLEDASSYLNSIGQGRVFSQTCDVTNESQVTDFIKKAAEQLGGIDILVNSAGRSIMKHFFDLTNAEWDEQIKLKYYSIIYTVRAVYPYMKEKGQGRIININATLAKEPETRLIATAATRAGLLNLSKALSRELAKDNILVNSVSLGVIVSEQWERRRLQQAPNQDKEEYYKQLAESRNIPLGRVGLPEEVASAILFLASKQASYITGTCIEVSGGLSKVI